MRDLLCKFLPQGLLPVPRVTGIATQAVVLPLRKFSGNPPGQRLVVGFLGEETGESRFFSPGQIVVHPGTLCRLEGEEANPASFAPGLPLAPVAVEAPGRSGQDLSLDRISIQGGGTGILPQGAQETRHRRRFLPTELKGRHAGALMKSRWGPQELSQCSLAELRAHSSQTDALSVSLLVQGMTGDAALLMKDVSALPDLRRSCRNTRMKPGRIGNEVSRNVRGLLLRTFSPEDRRHVRRGPGRFRVTDPPGEPVLPQAISNPVQRGCLEEQFRHHRLGIGVMTGCAALFGHQATTPSEGPLLLQGGIFRIVGEDSGRDRFPGEVAPFPEKPQGGNTLRRRRILHHELMLPTP